MFKADGAETARGAVLRAGGSVTSDLPIIRAVGAVLNDREAAALRAQEIPRLKVFDDARVIASSAAGALPETYYPSEVSAQELQIGGINGSGVTVAVIDSGLGYRE